MRAMPNNPSLWSRTSTEDLVDKFNNYVKKALVPAMLLAAGCAVTISLLMYYKVLPDEYAIGFGILPLIVGLILALVSIDIPVKYLRYRSKYTVQELKQTTSSLTFTASEIIDRSPAYRLKGDGFRKKNQFLFVADDTAHCPIEKVTKIVLEPWMGFFRLVINKHFSLEFTDKEITALLPILYQLGINKVEIEEYTPVWIGIVGLVIIIIAVITGIGM